MVRVNVSMITETSDNQKRLKEKAVELVAASLLDKGNISYDLYQSVTNDDRFELIETWESKEDLKAHQESEHFKRLLPELEKYSTLTIEVFDF